MSDAITFVTMLGKLTRIELESIVDVYPFGKGSILVVQIGDEVLESEVFEPAAEVRRLINKELDRRRTRSAGSQASG